MYRSILHTLAALVLLTLLPLHDAAAAQISLRYMHEQSLSLESSYYALNGHPGGKPKFLGTHGYIVELTLPSRIALAQSYMQGGKSGSLQGFDTTITRRELGAEISYRMNLTGPLHFRPFAHAGWVRSELRLDDISQSADSARLAAGVGLLLHAHNRRSRLLADLEARMALEAPIPSRFEPAGRWSGNLLTFGLSMGLGGGTSPWPDSAQADSAGPSDSQLAGMAYGTTVTGSAPAGTYPADSTVDNPH